MLVKQTLVFPIYHHTVNQNSASISLRAGRSVSQHAQQGLKKSRVGGVGEIINHANIHINIHFNP